MSTASARVRVTDRGQVTFRRSLLDHVGARPGDQLDLVPMPDNRLEVRVVKSGSIEAFIGSMPNDGSPQPTLEEIDRAIGEGWARRF